MVRHGLLAGVAACVLLAPFPARAEALAVGTSLGSWEEAIAVLRADVESEGRSLRIAVRAGGERVPCDRYLLQLDEAAGAAFVATSCDPATEETVLVLAHRSALFDADADIPRPRTVAITAILRATAVAQGGLQGGSLVRCSVAVRPYLDDALHGTRVMLTPERYALRPGSASVTVSPEPGGWSLSTEKRATFRIRYQIVSRATGELVLDQDTNLSCGPDPVSSPPASHPAYGPSPRYAYSPAQAVIPDAGHFNTAAGVMAALLAGGAIGAFTGATAASDTPTRAALYATGGLAGVGGIVAASVFFGSIADVHRRRKQLGLPTVSFSNGGATVGAVGSF